MTQIKKYVNLFDELKRPDVTQFESHISASQYLLAYNLILDNATSSAHVLDWGTGTGHFSLFLLEQKFKVTGFSIEKHFALADHLLSKFPDKYLSVSDPKSVKNLPFSDNSFDIVTSIGVLKHVRETGGDETGSLSEIERILKPGGLFICYHLPNKYSWIESIVKHLPQKYNHQYKYSRRDVFKLFKQVNLEIQDTKRYGLFPSLIFWGFSNNLIVTNFYNLSDKIFSSVFNLLCQNHYIIAKKTS